MSIDKFSDLKYLNKSKETKIYRHSWKQRAKISITAKFEEKNIIKLEYYGHAKFAHFVYYCIGTSYFNTHFRRKWVFNHFRLINK